MSAPALLVLADHEPPVFARSTLHRATLAPAGFAPEAAWWALLGQDPIASWRGPAPVALAASGGVQAEDETVYLLTPVRAEGARIEAALALPEGTQAELLAELEERLEDELLLLRAGPFGPTLALAEDVAGPPSVAGEVLAGRELSDLAAGPPELLRRVVAVSAEACAARGRPRGATHLFPHAPARAGTFVPLREAWLGLPSVAFVGGPLARAFAQLLGGTHWPAAGDAVLPTALAQRAALVVAVLPEGQLGLERAPERLAWAGPPAPGEEGVTLPLRVRGGPGPDLRAWALT